MELMIFSSVALVRSPNFVVVSGLGLAGDFGFLFYVLMSRVSS